MEHRVPGFDPIYPSKNDAKRVSHLNRKHRRQLQSASYQRALKVAKAEAERKSAVTSP